MPALASPVWRRLEILSSALLLTQISLTLPLRLSCQALPTIRQLGPIVDRSSFTVGSVAATRELPRGKILANDIVSRRLYVFDSALVHSTIVLDSTVGASNSYGDSPGGIVPFKGDSTLFVDPSSISLLVLDQDGRVARVMAGPRLSEIPFLLGGPYGTPGFDPLGRLVFRGSARRQAPTTHEPTSYASLVDSAPIVRLDLRTRKTDTIAQFRIARTQMTMTQSEAGKVRASALRNPMPIVDDWSILPDGSIAVVRGQDFHIDFIQPDGTRRPSARIPFPWRRLDDDEKKAFVDSVRRATDSVVAKTRAAIAARIKDTTIARPEPVEFVFTPPSELPDYVPAFQTNSTHTAPTGELWIRTSQIVAGRPVYYVVSSKGQLIDRVQLPSGRVISGFGSNHLIYLAFIDSSGGVRLERARDR